MRKGKIKIEKKERKMKRELRKSLIKVKIMWLAMHMEDDMIFI